LERQDEPFCGVLRPESVDSAWRYEDQRVGFDGEMIKIDVKGGHSVRHPEDLVKIVSVRALPILAVSDPIVKRADVKPFSGAGSVIGKRKNRRLGRFRIRNWLA